LSFGACSPSPLCGQLACCNQVDAAAAGWQVSEEYLEHLLVLARKIAFINSNDAARGSQARRDVEAVLEKLRNRAIAKVRLTIEVLHEGNAGLL
jgi:hypothetical protein